MSTGTSNKGLMTVAKTCPESMLNAATATAIASSKLLFSAVKATEAVKGSCTMYSPLKQNITIMVNRSATMVIWLIFEMNLQQHC